MEACVELANFNRKIVEDFKKDSLKTLCLLTKTPELNHNLFEWEEDKRLLIKELGNDSDKIRELMKLIEELRMENGKMKDELEDLRRRVRELEKQNEVLIQDKAELEKEVEDLKKRVKELEDLL